MKKFFAFLVLTTAFLFNGGFSLAKTDLSITDVDITFSKEEPLEGEIVRVFARVFNIGDTDVYGYVSFLNNGREMADPQPISVKVNTYDDVFIDWETKAGNFNIEARIIGLNLTDDNPENNKTLGKEISVDLDSDNDKIGNAKDPDDDNDGLTDDQESILKTDLLNQDTDGDKIKDNIDVFPLDKNEWKDTDNDELGDNQDLDDDNDNLSDEDELFVYGTNPLNPDTDNDGLGDKKEIALGTNPNKADTDSDGVIDSQDKAPLNPAIGRTYLTAALSRWFGDKLHLYIIVGVLATAIIFLVFRRKKRN